MKILKHIALLIIVNILSSCQTDELVSALEPKITNPNLNTEIGEIVVDYIESDNNSIYFTWNIQQSVSRYDIIINDTITKRQIDESRFVNGAFYTVEGLESDLEHKIMIRAFDKNENITTKSFSARTKKDLVVDVKQIVLNKNEYSYLGFENCFVTKSKNFIITGSVLINGKHSNIIFKLTKEYKIEWLSELPFISMPSVSEFLDGSLLLVHSSGVIKLSTSGLVIWNKDIETSDISIYAGFAAADNTTYLAGSRFEYGPTHQFYILKLDQNGNMLWEDYGEKKTSIDMYWPNKIFINKDNNVIITGGTWNDGASYPGKENLFFFEYNQQGKILSEKTYTINDIPYFFNTVDYIEKKDDGSYMIFTPVSNWDTGQLHIETLNINLDSDFNLLEYKFLHHLGGGAVSRTSVHKRTDGLYSLLSNERGDGPLTYLIFTKINERGEPQSSFGFQEYEGGIMAFGEDKDKTLYMTRNGLIVTLNDDGVNHGVPRLIPDEIIQYK